MCLCGRPRVHSFPAKRNNMQNLLFSNVLHPFLYLLCMNHICMTCLAFGTGAVCPARGQSSIKKVSLSCVRPLGPVLCVRPLGPVLCARPAAGSLLKQCVLIHIIVRTGICIRCFILLEKTAEKIVKSTALHQQKREQHIHSARLTAVSAASPCSH